MKELYKSFERQSDVLPVHHTRRDAAIKAFEDVLGWKTHIRDKPPYFPIMDKLWAKKTEVTIETLEGMCDAIESIIQDGQATCKCIWTTADVFLGFLGIA